MIEEQKRRCIIRKCDCTFNLVGGPKSNNGCPDEQLCKKCYSKYFSYSKPKNEETWKNAEKKMFRCPNCNAPFNYKEDRDYHCKNMMCPRIMSDKAFINKIKKMNEARTDEAPWNAMKKGKTQEEKELIDELRRIIVKVVSEVNYSDDDDSKSGATKDKELQAKLLGALTNVDKKNPTTVDGILWGQNAAFLYQLVMKLDLQRALH